jgi:hypothetical protein
MPLESRHLSQHRSYHLQRSIPREGLSCIRIAASLERSWILPFNTVTSIGKHLNHILLRKPGFLFSSFRISSPPLSVKHSETCGLLPAYTYQTLLSSYFSWSLGCLESNTYWETCSSHLFFRIPLTQPMSSSRQAVATVWQAPVTPPALATAMEAAMAGAAEVSRVGRRIIQKIWDPEPVNNRVANEPVWCLGCSYTLDTKTYGSPPASSSATSTSPLTDTIDPPPAVYAHYHTSHNTPDTPPDSVASSFDSSLAYEDPGQDGGWPPAFLDDFESRIWMTYRNAFDPIPRSTDPKAATHLSFTMRLRTSLGDQNEGFSSDTGWGCMIRSGQSLLANAISVIRLGRGKN